MFVSWHFLLVSDYAAFYCYLNLIIFDRFGMFISDIDLVSFRFYQITLSWNNNSVNGKVISNNIFRNSPQILELTNISHSESQTITFTDTDQDTEYPLVIHCQQGVIEVGDKQLFDNHLCATKFNQAIQRIRKTRQPITFSLSPPSAAVKFQLMKGVTALFLIVPLLMLALSLLL